MSPGFSTSSESEIWSDNYALCGLTEDAEKQDYMDMNEVSREYLRNYMIYLHKRKAALICKLHRRDMKKFGPYLESYFRLKESRKRDANHESRRLFEKLGEDSELSDTFSSDEDYTIKPSSSMLKYIVESEIMDGERNCLLLKGTISDKRGREGMLEKAYYNEYNVFKKKCMRDLDEIYENDLNYNNLNSEPSLLRPHVKKRPLEREIGDSKSHLETLNSSHNKESKQALTESHYVQIWTTLVNRNVNRSAKMMQNFRTTKINNMFKVAQVCAKESKRAKPVQVKIIAKMKKISKDVALFWRKNEREVRDLKKIAEKDALEQKKREEELLEARRQARKLNFLITQTELYSHFIAKKLQASEDRDTSDEHYNENLDEPDFDKENDEELLLRAKGSAKKALLKHGEATKRFDMETLRMKRNALKEEQKKNLSLSADMVDKMDFMNPSSLDMDSEVEVPKMLTVTLKAYQVKGLRWLANLYEQGINGILADEMGLGKTVQSIALMAYLAERYNIWGPFLIVSPLSTLHNWQQEIVRFAPDLKVIPYWGDQRDRAVIRKLWSSNKIYTKNTPFHVIITSYQIVVIDEHHLKKVRWHYMILDEAQAIKSSDSTRWKTLLGFDCRSRLLLTGTPIQNSMQELWALLHFIMPSLFDSHKEFSSWFSRDIECHAENKGSLNEQQLQKLHVILKPFMLRRVKKDVENELSEKIEIELRCNLSVRQKMLYKLLKERLLSSELLDKVSLMSEKQIIGSRFGDNIMNLVMQFRKVCNHPALFEKSDIWSPLFFSPVRHIPSGAGRHNCHIPYSAVSLLEYKMPKLFTLNGFLDKKDCTSDKVKVDIDLFALHNIRESLSRNSIFSFLPFCGLSMSEIHKISRARYPTELFLFWLLKMEKLKPIQDYQNFNCMEPKMRSMLNIVNRNPLPKFCDLYMKESSTRRFTSDPPIASSLGDFLIKNYTYDIKRRLQRAVKTKVYSSICSLDAGSHPYSKWMKDNITHEKTMSAILTGNTCSKLHNTWHTQLFYEWIDLLKPFYVSSESRITKVASSPSALGTKFSGLLGDSDKNQSHYDVIIPSVYRLISDSGKLYVLDKILPELKAGGHRILAFFQMTKMIDIMEDYLALRKYTYIRLDGSTNISDRREMVMDWQSRPDLFIFLLSTRAGGIGINLTAADTVIFYDSDWNPTVDQQAMDRCHRLGQKKQVTIYRLITADTIEERILTRAQQKDKIQRVVIPGGEFKQQVEFKHKEMYNLLLEEGENNEYKGSGTLKE